MGVCVLLTFALLLSTSLALGKSHARDGRPIPKKSTRDVGTVVKMKYYHPIKIAEIEKRVPELRATIIEHKPDDGYHLGADLITPNRHYEPAEISAPLTDGGISWSAWTTWGECSLSCGGGVSSRTRICVSRYAASEIDLACDGQSVGYRLCNTQDCPKGSTDFRSKQCSEHDDEPYFGQNYKWTAFNGPDGSTCELQCRAEDMSVYHTTYLSFGSVRDGTKCGVEGVCIAGECMDIGCDGVIGSNRKKDQCGVCTGDNSTCVQIYNTVQHVDGRSPDYHRLADIPIGATNVIIKDYNKCHLALFEIDEDDNQNSIINGNWLINFPGQYDASGVSVIYDRVGEKESIRILGPTKKIIRLMSLIVNNKKQPSVEYEYWVPKSSSDASTAALGTGRRVLAPQIDYLQLIKDHGFDVPDLTDNTPAPTKATTTTVPSTTTTTTKTTTTTAVQSSFEKETAKSKPSVRPAQCSKKLGGKKKLLCESDFAVEIRILPWPHRAFGRYIRYPVEILHKYKTNIRLSQREYILMPSACYGKLQANDVYFVMGRTRPKTIASRPGIASNRVADRYRREFVLIGHTGISRNLSHKLHSRMAKLSRRARCKRYKRVPARFGRRRTNVG